MYNFPKFFFIFLIFLSSYNLFAKDNSLGENNKTSFSPKFTLGSGFYTLTGDIQNADLGFLNGQLGYNAGMKFELSEIEELSFLLFKNSFFGDNGVENFNSEVDGFGLSYNILMNKTFKQFRIIPFASIGMQLQGVSTSLNGLKSERVNNLSVPLGIGLRMDISNKLQFDILMNFAMGLGDIDMSKINENSSDGYKSLNFTLHYDLFTYVNPKNNKFPENDNYYDDVDFSKIESEDEDGDLVSDMFDYCPRTPIGVKVDINGCPLDDDLDGIANYLDKQKDTPLGSIVDENGVMLSAEKYRSTNTKTEVASRKYANFYNEFEIKREDYKTVDEYLIAKANAFNKAFNESQDDNSKVNGLIYKIKIAEFNETIPAKMLNKLLSLDDLESFVIDDNSVIYAIGSYNNLNDAQIRQDELDKQWYDETEIIVDNNGLISVYTKPTLNDYFDEDEIVVPIENDIEEASNNDLNNSTIFRIQIGAFRNPLSDQIFLGLDNVISFNDKNKLTIYMVGSFTKYEDAIDYQSQMQARGFKDAFIVTYKNGERINLNIVIANKNTQNNSSLNKNNNDDSVEVVSDLNYTVQILVAEATLSSEVLKRMSKIGTIDKKAKGSDMYEYYAGSFSDLNKAKIQLEKARNAGFDDAFIFADKNGVRVSIEDIE